MSHSYYTIKPDKCLLLSNNLLKDIHILNSDIIPLRVFHPEDDAIDLFWHSKSQTT